MYKQILLFLLFGGIIAAITGCQKEDEPKMANFSPISKQESLLLLKSWYKENKQLLKSNNSQLLLGDYEWSLSSNHLNKHLNESHITVPAQGRMLVIFSKIGSNATLYFCQLLPDSTYLVRKRDVVDPADFCGFVVLFDAQREPLEAYRVVNGLFEKTPYAVRKVNSFTKARPELSNMLPEVVVVGHVPVSSGPDILGSPISPRYELQPVQLMEPLGGSWEYSGLHLVPSGGAGPTNNPGTNPKPEIDTTGLQNHPVINCVYQKLINANSSVLRDMLSKFWGNNTNTVVRWSVENYAPNDKYERGQASKFCYNRGTGQISVDITLNEGPLTNASVLIIAQTILHEAIHAELWAKVCLKENLPAEAKCPYTTFDGLINAYNKQYGADQGDHVFTADMYIERMASALEAFHKPFRAKYDRWKNSDGNFDYKTLYTMLAWLGLGNTPQWKVKEKDPAFNKLFNQAIKDANGETKDCPN